MPRHSNVIAIFFNKKNKIWQEAMLPSPVQLFTNLLLIFDAILMMQCTKVLLDGPRRTEDPEPDEVFDIAMDAKMEGIGKYEEI